MLSSGTRIGTTRILSWLGEGSTGQSYHCESTEGDLRGNPLYVKLVHRQISRKWIRGLFPSGVPNARTIGRTGDLADQGIRCDEVEALDWLRLAGGENFRPKVRRKSSVIRSLDELMNTIRSASPRAFARLHDFLASRPLPHSSIWNGSR